MSEYLPHLRIIVPDSVMEEFRLERRRGWRLAIRRPRMALAHFRLLKGKPLLRRIVIAIRLAMS